MRIRKGSEILKNINKPLKREIINTIYENNGVNHTNCLLYAEFIISLLINVTDTYAGDDVVIGDIKEKHFKWCWDKVFDNKTPDKLYIYLFSFTDKVFYNNPDKSDDTRDDIFNYWLYVFDTGTLKTKTDVNSFLYIYDLFEKSFNINV